MKIRTLTAALLVASLPAGITANAQEAATSPGTAAAPTPAAEPAVGATVYDASGAEVGTIKSIAAPNFVIDTGKNSATLALSALGTGPKGPVLGMTKAQLDEAAEKASSAAKAETSAAIVADAPIYASDGSTQLGKVVDVTETDFVLDTGSTRVKLPKTSVAKGASGLMIGMTAEAFADATKSAGGGNAPKTAGKK